MDLWRGLRGLGQVPLFPEHWQFFFRRRVAGQDDGAAVGRRQMHVTIGTVQNFSSTMCASIRSIFW